jgi:hypothetical protein
MRTIPLVEAVGKNCANRPGDVKAVHEALVSIGKLPRGASSGVFDDKLYQAIVGVQRYFLARPDGVISVGGRTHQVLKSWREKRIDDGVQLPGRLRDAWKLVSPLLPEGSYCSSGYRSAEHQRAILQGFFKGKYKTQIIEKYGQAAYDTAAADLLANEKQVLEMVRGVGQAIAAPGASKHQQGKAVDVGGPAEIDAKQVDVIKGVALAHPELFCVFVLKERNGCVHFEIL